MGKRLAAMSVLSLFLAACGGSSSSTAPGSSLAGTWSGSASDSTTAALGNGGMMGQGGMGTMTWQLAQNGSNVTGTVRFAGMASGMMAGTISGTMSGQDMTFTMDMPAGSMMMGGTCSAHSTGTAHMDAGAMTMTGNYSGTNSCAGSFNNGQMTMTRR